MGLGQEKNGLGVLTSSLNCGPVVLIKSLCKFEGTGTVKIKAVILWWLACM